MHLVSFAFAVTGLLLSNQALADRSHPFIRIACVPENGLLDVDLRHLHDSVRGAGRADAAGNSTLARAGYHRPRGLRQSCTLGSVRYQIAVEQAETSNFQCGGVPEITLTLTRNGVPVLDQLVFGESCLGRAHAQHFTLADGPRAAQGRSMSVCYVNGKNGSEHAAHCEWTSGSDDIFARRFPVSKEQIPAILTGKMRP